MLNIFLIFRIHNILNMRFTIFLIFKFISLSGMSNLAQYYFFSPYFLNFVIYSTIKPLVLSPFISLGSKETLENSARLLAFTLLLELYTLKPSIKSRVR